MKIAYFDCFAGISGDMTVGALLDLGLELAVLKQELQKLPLDGYRLETTPVDKLGIRATQFRVLLPGPQGEQLADAEFQEVNPGGDSPEQAEDAPEPHHHHHHHHHHASGEKAPHEHRSLAEILALINHSALSPKVKATASEIFTRLGQAEAQVHGMPLEEVHFHEVGGVDAIVDIVSVAIGLEQLGLERIYASPLHLGRGFVRCAHGLYPVPAPATANLTAGVPVYSTAAKGELVTPTGAAIITTLAHQFGPMPVMTPHATGYGAGSRDREFPNVLRIILGEVQAGQAMTAANHHHRGRDPFPEQHDAPQSPAGYHEGPAVIIETTIDDMNPQLFENLVDRLLAADALDVTLIPVQMKKSRPGTVLHVLAHPSSVDRLLSIIFTESTSIGVRTYEVTKHMLQREIHTVETPFGPVRVKVARLKDRIVNISPEYEDCRHLAQQHEVPVKEVYNAARQGFPS
jgi:hypothetical protein